MLPLFIVAVLLFGVGMLVWQSNRSHDIIALWAQENGYRILSQDFAPFKGPFFWSSSRGQTVYHVVVADESGRQREGWVRCGSWWGGLLSSQVEVQWKE